MQNTFNGKIHILDMDLAVERVLHALKHKQKIVVYGDYDVDGATSTALLRRYFQDIGYPIALYIPDRIEEGYGANTEALLKLRAKGYDLVLMTDCGTTAFIPIEEALKVGLDVIVLDHHLSEVAMPKAHAIINPNRIDQKDVGLSNLCAAGVAFLFMIALQRKLDQKELPDLMNYLDLVALGTVCDVMPLTGLNRAFVKNGLKILQSGQNIGLRALCDVANVSERLSTYHLGFVLGPRINAGGRVGEADLGSRLLTTHNYAEAKEIAEKLNTYNLQRQEMEKAVLEASHNLIQKSPLQDVILVGDESWHPGVIGIVASRLKDYYRRPACVVGFMPDGEGKGSGRSVYGRHLGEAMHRAVRSGILKKGGGHAMAAGFSVMKDQFENFQNFLNQELPLSQETATVHYDAIVPLSEITASLIHSFKKLEPFGQGCPSPRFVIENVKVQSINIIKQDHMRCQIVDEKGVTLKVMAFRAVGTPLEQGFRHGGKIDILGDFDINTWGGQQSVYMKPQDIRIHS
jgi:single-stranded-DNA-specific exonuclease